ncbi:MAG: copper resistance protein NlpE N-terminal domain-containing protein [Bacteroidia bacterium]|nr:copper resistance protein NlpE N-terminal domain-containing protein [Bacteroidia bacterium]
MKHLLILSGLTAVYLTACNDAKKEGETKIENATASTSTLYKGTLPGGEFKGINATLELTTDSNCMMTYLYDGIDTKLVDKGKWRMNGDMLQTTFTEVPKLYKMAGDSITQLDDSGNLVEDGFSHVLRKQ